jgi:hypothetical protein
MKLILFVILVTFLSNSVLANQCQGDFVDQAQADVVAEALGKTFNKMDTPYTNPSALELYELQSICPTFGTDDYEAKLTVLYSEVYIDDSPEDTYLETTECIVYLYNDEGVWGAMEVVCENDNFYWSY